MMALRSGFVALCAAGALFAFAGNAAACGEDKDKDSDESALCGEDKDKDSDESVRPTPLCGEDKDKDSDES
jgi:hypothetical protein